VLVLTYDKKSILFKLQAASGNRQRIAIECHLDGTAMLWADQKSGLFLGFRENLLSHAFNHVVTLETNA
jgi:hypothetical protein